ncbi:MAG TPA: thioesterase family protein [Polyangiales bacterium]|nr:thioesterase family protein [Polyangiales bacterium]
MQFQIGNFSADTAVTPDPARPGRYRATLSSDWNILYVFGGVTMATAISAARAALSQPSFELLTATATYVGPISAGPQMLDVRTLRSGRGAEQLVVEMRSGEPDGRAPPDLFVVCTFGPRRESETKFVELTMPDVPGPDEAVRAKPPSGAYFARLPFHYSVEQRTVLGNMPWFTDWEAGPARWAAWHRLRNTPRLDDGTVDPLTYAVAGDMIGPAVRQAQGGKAPLTMMISLEICLHVFARTDSEWLLQDSQGTQAGDGYASGRVNLWDAHGRLVAQATQRALLRPMPG